MAATSKRRVLLFCVESLFGESLIHILSEVEDVQLLGPYPMGAQATVALPDVAPDIAVIVSEDSETPDIASLTSLLLGHYPGLAIVRIGLQDNVMQVYSSRTLPASLADLLEVIHSQSPTNEIRR